VADAFLDCGRLACSRPGDDANVLARVMSRRILYRNRFGDLLLT
jgi:hypothetical protein